MRIFLSLSFLLFIVSCSSNENSHNYLRWVGDSAFKEQLDSTNFQLCNGDKNASQYFHFQEGMQYVGEKISLINHFFDQYKSVDVDQSGWIRIRFVVNCKGETGRFRVICSDQEYTPQVFDPKITDQLLTLTKSLNGWVIQRHDQTPKDYYQYLIFKIDNGKLIEIMP